MTAPFAPPPSKPVLAVVGAMIVVSIALPFGRRNDWIGTVALVASAAATVVVWGLLIWGLVRNWREGR